MSEGWNIVVVVADTFRTAYLGAYGNDWIHTPNLDRFARQGVRFTNAHTECLPTVPTRRTLHTGRRAFPFPTYTPVPWDNVYIPGWQPMSADEPAIAEALVRSGYHTGFFADVPHYFVPGMNFTRGFRQWEFVRGQAEDRYRAVAHADEAVISRYQGNPNRIRAHLVNVQPQRPEETWPTARLFRSAIEFVEQNAGHTPFYLYVDGFTPHETWEAPLHYYDLYGRREDREPILLNLPYRPLDDEAVEARLASVRANYAGLITLVDTWFGKLVETIDRLGLGESTLILFLSDHGTNFADNGERVTGKPAGYMYPGTMDIPLIVRHPAGRQRRDRVRRAGLHAGRAGHRDRREPGAGGRRDRGAEPAAPRGGRAGLQSPREYLTCRYGNFVWYKDAKSWYFSSVDFQEPRLFDLEADPECRENIAAKCPERIALARERILTDAGGRLPRYEHQGTDALGRPEFTEQQPQRTQQTGGTA